MSDLKGSYLSFRVGMEWYGIPVGLIIEVLNLVMLSELPGADDDVLGLMTLRNMTFPVVDLRRRFHLRDSNLSLSTPIITFSTPDGPMGVVVDDVEDVVEVTETSEYHGGMSRYVNASCKLPNKLLMLLNPDALRPTALSAVEEPEKPKRKSRKKASVQEQQ